MQTNEKAKSLIGSWRVVTTAVDQKMTFPALMTFTGDGIVFASEPPAPLETPGHGSWVSTGPNDACFTFLFFIGNADSNLTQKGKVNGTAHYEADTDFWKGQFTIEIADAKGKQVMTDHGTFAGNRIRVEM